MSFSVCYAPHEDLLLIAQRCAYFQSEGLFCESRNRGGHPKDIPACAGIGSYVNLLPELSSHGVHLLRAILLWREGRVVAI